MTGALIYYNPVVKEKSTRSCSCFDMAEGIAEPPVLKKPEGIRAGHVPKPRR